MNESNVTYLKDGLKYLGFGDKLNAELEKQIAQKPEKFMLAATQEYRNGKDTQQVEYRLDFTKSEKSDMYFFNKYQAILKGENEANTKTQTFYVNKNNGITAKESFNLLNGRSVYSDFLSRENEKYNAWVKIDFASKNENGNYNLLKFMDGYGYNLEAALSKLPIKEIQTPEQRDKILKSLSKGNLHEVTFTKGGKENKMYVEANPQFKNITVYDSAMKRQYQENTKSEKQSTSDNMKTEAAKKSSDEEGPARQHKEKKKGVKI